MSEILSDEATQLIFQTSIGQKKPRTLLVTSGDKSSCPFCDHSQLPAILKRDGDILLVPNKYPILKDSDPYVLIETGQCESELSLYSESHLYKVFNMALETWFEMMSNPQFASVLFLKNHGPFSGGSIRHPHMQLIGLRKVDYRRNIDHKNFQGPVIWEKPGVSLTVSAWPRVGFVEFNVILKDKSLWKDMSLLIQKTVQYMLNQYSNGRVTSYNFFFYYLDDIIYCKLMPRFVTTPLFVGYSIPQVSDNILDVAKDFQKLYF